MALKRFLGFLTFILVGIVAAIPPQRVSEPPLTTTAAPDMDAIAARDIVRSSDWCTVAHISAQKATDGYPQARVFSVVDGPVFNSTGVPYIYAPIIDEGVRDLIKDGRCSMTMSLAEGDFCRTHSFDPEDPRCSQVILSGKCAPVPNNTMEWVFARDALFTKHPIMAKWPVSHTFLVIKLNIANIILVDNFGGNKYPSVNSYLAVNPNDVRGADAWAGRRPSIAHKLNPVDELDDQIEVIEVQNYV